MGTAPTTIGPYRVLDTLGEGGMGTVFLGEHTLLGRRAAIKVLLPDLSAKRDIVKRFFNEARAVTQIADPGIVQVFDFGFDADGAAYIVMELLEGESLSARLRRVKRMSVPDCLRLARMAATSLAAAHAKGIVHRDLKPDNIFVVGDPAVTGGERPKILDFGIAKLQGDDAPDSVKTQTGVLIGTPVYMAPEQCRGFGEIDHRADIYSFGCLMFRMLTGRPPFEGPGSGDLIAAHLREPAPLAQSVVASVPEIIDQILQRCMAKSPAVRFQSMTELAETIAAVEELLQRSSQPTFAYGAYGVPAPTPPALTPPPVAPLEPNTGTTISGASGQTAPPIRAPHDRKLVFVGVAAAAIAIAGIVAIAVIQRRGHEPTATAAPSEPIAPTIAPAAAPAPAPAPPAATPPDAAELAATPATPIDAAPPPPPPTPHRTTKRTAHGTTSSPPADPIDRGD